MMGSTEISPAKAALLAGIGYLLMLGTPLAEFFAMPNLLNGDGALTFDHVVAHQHELRMAIAGYTINFAGDILAAWGLYILLKPVNRSLSLLTCWLRIIYTVISLAALLNLMTILSVATKPEPYDTAFLNNQVNLLYSAFTDGWRLCYIFFGLCLCLLGWLICKAQYMPKWIGVWVIAAGLGWLINSLRVLLFPGFHINFAVVAVTGLGEMVLMGWLLIKGWRVKVGS